MADDVVAPLATATAAVTEAAKQFNLTEGKCYGGEELGIDVLGLVAIIVFYLAVLGVRKFKSTAQLLSHLTSVVVMGLDHRTTHTSWCLCCCVWIL